MLRGRSLRTKLTIIMIVVSSMTLGTAVLGIVIVDHLATKMNSLLAERVPLSRCSEQAMLASAEASIAMHKAREIEDPADTEELADLQGQLQDCMIRFDMFVQAMICGSESDEFRSRAGGADLRRLDACRLERHDDGEAGIGSRSESSRKGRCRF